MAAIIASTAFAAYISLFSYTRIDGYLFPGNEVALPVVRAAVPGTDIAIDVSLPGVPAAGEVPWTPDDRLNILVLGLDRRPYEPIDGPSRSDTLFVASIDKHYGTVQLLAIPRDTWVDVPVTGEVGEWYDAKVTTAYSYGVSEHYPGGGAQAAIDTVQHNFNIQIDHYLVIDWVGFVQLVDAMGGLEVDVPAPISDFGTDVLDTFPNSTVSPGLQHMTGEQALGYSRTRSDGDLKRIERQQVVIKAAAAKAIELGYITDLLSVWDAYKGAIRTDVNDGLIPGFALLAQDLDLENMTTYSLGPAMFGSISEDGQSILVQKRDQVFAIIDGFLADPGVMIEQPRVVIEYVPGQELEAELARQHLVAYGVPPAFITVSPETGSEAGIFNLTEDEYTAVKMASLFDLRLLNPGPAESALEADVLVRLGDSVEVRSP